MPETILSVTEASRNFAECVNRVRYQGASYLLQKNGTPVARLVPVELEIADERATAVRVTESSSAKQTAKMPEAETEEPGADTSRGTPTSHDALNW